MKPFLFIFCVFFLLFSLHHCPCLKGQSRGRPDPAPNPQSPGTGTHPLQHCFQLQGVKGRGEMLNKKKVPKKPKTGKVRTEKNCYPLQGTEYQMYPSYGPSQTVVYLERRRQKK